VPINNANSLSPSKLIDLVRDNDRSGEARKLTGNQEIILFPINLQGHALSFQI